MVRREGRDDDYKNRARKRAQERAASIWMKLKEGDNTFRILPTPKSKTSPSMFIEYSVHRDVGPNRSILRCGKDPVTREGSCYICDVYVPRMQRKGKNRTAEAVRARDVLVMQVAKVGDDDKMTGPFLWQPAKRTGDQVLASIFG